MFSATGELKFYASKAKLLRAAAIMFLVGGIIMLITLKGGDWGMSGGSVGFVLAVLCICVGFFYLVRLVRQPPELSLTPEWIHIGTGVGTVGLMWQDVAAIWPLTNGRQKLILIIPTDFEVFVSRQSALAGVLLRMNRHLLPAPIAINASLLSLSVDEVMAQLLAYGKTHVPHFSEGVADAEQQSETNQVPGDVERGAEADVTAPESTPLQPAARSSHGWRVVGGNTSVLLALVIISPLIALVFYIHANFPEYEVPGFIISLALSCLLMLWNLRVRRQMTLLFSLSFGMAAVSAAFAIAYGWIYGIQVVYVAVVACFVLVGFVLRSRLFRLIQKDPAAWVEYNRHKSTPHDTAGQ